MTSPSSARIHAQQLSLMLVTDSLACGERSLPEVVAAAVAGGVTCVQLREKLASGHVFLDRARALRQLPAPWCHIPVVALTANTNPLDEQQALQAGIDMVLHKPINPKALVRTVSQALGAATPRGSA